MKAEGTTGFRTYLVLFTLTCAAILVHGYHPFVEDAEIYIPGIKKMLDPSLYPHNAEFFQAHAGMTLFPNLVASSVRWSHIPLEYALLIWHFVSIYLLLLGCFQVAVLCFAPARARWGGVAVVAALLTIPVAGTALYIVDEYFNPRSLSTALLVLSTAAVLNARYLAAAVLMGVTAAVHPLMSLFGLSFLAILILLDRRGTSVHGFLPSQLFPPVTEAYRKSLESHSYFFLSSWQWYEWLGIFAPFGLLWWFSRIAAKTLRVKLRVLSRALLLFGFCFFALALLLMIPPFENLGELQPMRSLHPIYVFLFLMIGGFLGERVLKGVWWRWVALFLPICLGMWYAQRELFPASPHLEWPGRETGNGWVQGFRWIRDHTPVDSYFALDPKLMEIPGEDQQGFRAIAERSMLADDVKDGGAVSMFPALAGKWQEQVRAQQGWHAFQLQDFQRLKREFGVNWAVLQPPGLPGLPCLYQSPTMAVCRID